MCVELANQFFPFRLDSKGSQVLLELSILLVRSLDRGVHACFHLGDLLLSVHQRDHAPMNSFLFNTCGSFIINLLAEVGDLLHFIFSVAVSGQLGLDWSRLRCYRSFGFSIFSRGGRAFRGGSSSR